SRPGIANLMSIMSALTGKTMDEITAEYDGQGYGKFKDAVAEPIQKRYDEISADKAYLQEVLTSGAERAEAIAYRTMLKIRKKIGYAPLKL
ncbi:tryptophan--tRNA ligase, partial [Acinetobacter baumannii]